MDDLISRAAAIDAIKAASKEIQHWLWEAEGCESYCEMVADVETCLDDLPSIQPEKRTEERTETHACDCIERQAAIDAIARSNLLTAGAMLDCKRKIEKLPSAQPEQRYTEEELRVFRHGISLSLLSKRSSQHWHYDDDTATEIEFLERLYEKVCADMRGDEDE